MTSCLFPGLRRSRSVIPLPACLLYDRLSFLLQNIKENVAAANVKLTAQEVQRIQDAAVAADKKIGDRYPPDGLDILYSDTAPLPPQ